MYLKGMVVIHDLLLGWQLNSQVPPLNPIVFGFCVFFGYFTLKASKTYFQK